MARPQMMVRRRRCVQHVVCAAIYGNGWGDFGTSVHRGSVLVLRVATAVWSPHNNLIIAVEILVGKCQVIPVYNRRYAASCRIDTWRQESHCRIVDGPVCCTDPQNITGTGVGPICKIHQILPLDYRNGCVGINGLRVYPRATSCSSKCRAVAGCKGVIEIIASTLGGFIHPYLAIKNSQGW